MIRRGVILGGIVVAIGFVLLVAALAGRSARPDTYSPPDNALVTFFPAVGEERVAPLVISASIEAGFMRPFILAFQRRDQGVAVAYIQSRNSDLLDRALAACHHGERAADIYLTSSTDHLVRLANENCAETLSHSVTALAPAQAAWRDQVVAFTVEPAAFVFGRSAWELGRSLPRSHIELLDWLRALPAGNDKVATYDVEASADGYDLAASDARQEAVYGRLLEGLGRSAIRLYCCSNVMVDAVDRGDVLFAYNVHLSYAYAAQRAGSRIVVILPNDYQALQTLSFMLPKRARDPVTARRFGAFLVSATARGVARRNLVPPGPLSASAIAQAEHLLDQAAVSPTSLSLQDRARRDHLVHSWREAIEPMPDRVRPAEGRAIGPLKQDEFSSGI